MNIEKIYLSNSTPGILDTWIYGISEPAKMDYFSKKIAQVFSKGIRDYAEPHKISFGKYHGKRGITPLELLSLQETDPDTWYEISAVELLLSRIPKRQVEHLCENYQLIIFDLYETGSYVDLFLRRFFDLKFKRCLFAITETKIYPFAFFSDNTKSITAANYIQPPPWEPFDRLPINTSILQIPFFNYCASANYANRKLGTINQVQIGSLTTKAPIGEGNKHKFLVPARHPHLHRVQFLSLMEQAGLLESTDWSLGVVTENNQKSGMLYGNNHIDTLIANAEKAGLTDVIDFLNKHRTQLPRLLLKSDWSEGSGNAMALDTAGYKWQVVTETWLTNITTTEKVFQAFAMKNPVLTIAAPGFNQALKTMGYKFQGDYDMLDGIERMQKTIDIMKNQTPDTTIVNHNYNLVHNIDHWSKHFVDQLLAVEGEPAPTRQ